MRLNYHKKYTGIDANDNTSATEWIRLRGASIVTYTIEGKTGTHSIHDFHIQFSPDGVYNAKGIQVTKINGTGYLRKLDMDGYRFIRIKCLVAEGSTSTVDIYVQAYR